MSSNRIGRVNEGIQRELAELLRQVKDPRVNTVGMVSVTRVDTASDLSYCKVYVSVLDKTREAEVLKGLKSASGFLRRELGRSLSLRHTPELHFFKDDSILRGANVLHILRNVRYSQDSEQALPDGEAAEAINSDESGDR